MLKEEKLIISIQKILNSNDIQDTPANRSVAKQYSDACNELNTRLERCSDYLHKNRPVEAVNYAEMSPPILEVAAKLDFPLLDEWIDVCSEFNWPQPVEIMVDTLELLNESYTDKVNLDPLLNAYRKKNRDGTIEEKIHLLRRIKDIDVANPSWEEQLVGLEKTYVKELNEKAEKALKHNDEILIQNVHAELTNPALMHKPQENLIGQLEGALHAFKLERLKNKAQHILTEVNDAYSMMDYKALEKAIKKWDRVVSQDGYSPESSDIQQVDEAKEWSDEQTKEKAQKQAYENAIMEIEEKLDQGTDETGIDNLFNKLQTYDEEIPQRLIKRYSEQKEDFRLVRKRRFVFKFALALIAVLLVAGGTVYLIHYQNQQKLYKKVVKEYNQALKSKDFVLAEKQLVDFKKKYPSLYSSKPDLTTKQKHVVKLLQEDRARASHVKELVAKCNKIVADGFPNGVKACDLMIADLEKKVKGAEEKQSLNTIKTARSNFIANEQQRQNEIYTKQTNKLFDIAKAIREVNPVIKSDEYQKKLEDFETSFHKLKTIRTDDKELADKTEGEFSSWLKNFKKEYEKGKLANLTWKRDRQQLYANVLNPTKYSRDLQHYQRKYKDYPDDENIPKTLKMIPLYKDAAQLESFIPNEAELSSIKNLKATMADASDTNIWKKPCEDYAEWRERFLKFVPIGREQLSKYMNEKIMQFNAWTFKKPDGGTLELFVEKNDAYKELTTKTGRQVCFTWVYVGKNKNFKMSFQKTGKAWNIYKGKFSPEKTIHYKEIIYPKITLIDKPEPGYIDFYRDFIARMKETTDDKLELLLTNEIKKIRTNDYDKHINRNMRIRFIKNILQLLGKISFKRSSDFNSQLKEMQDLLNDNIDLRVYSFNNQNPKAKEFSDAIDKALTNLEDLTDKVRKDKLEQKILELSLGRKIAPVGYIQKDTEGNSIPKLKKYGKYKELLILSNDSKLQFIVAGEMDRGKGNLNPELNSKLFEGQILFAPFDEKTSADLKKEITDYAETNGVKWDGKLPDVWPITPTK